jgi:hypothetical protein
MNPDLPDTELLDNPYQYTDYKSESTHQARAYAPVDETGGAGRGE